jgi:predicted transcriptional regulator
MIQIGEYLYLFDSVIVPMSVFKFDPAQKGLRKTLKEYEELALRHIWDVGEEGAGSGKTWQHVNEQLGEGNSISRASIIFFLNRMVEEAVLGYRDATGKGGHRRIYVPNMDEKGYKRYVVRKLCESVLEDFPEATREIIKEYSK